MIGRYGEAVERDLADRSFDLAALWRQRRFRYILNIVDGLPGSSHMGQAVADDEEAVDPTSLSDSGGRWRPTVRHQDETNTLLTAIHATLENLVAVSAEKYKPNFIPPPLTAADRVRARIVHEQGMALSRKLFPDR